MTDRDAPPSLLLLAGPTASGKTDVAVTLALRLGGELIGADSVQVYRGFDLGSAKPRGPELRGVPHHLLDVADADAPLDAMAYARLADRAIADVRARGRLPIVVGGTGLWLRALVRGLVEVPAVDPSLRARLEEEASLRGAPALHARLAEVDPRAAARIHPNDRLRIVRALEVFAQTGTPLGALQAAHALGAPRYALRMVALDRANEELYPRIEARVAAMLRAGFADEVRGLVAQHGEDVRALQSVGYREMVEHVARGVTLEETTARILQSTKTYVRRQRTWLKNEPGIDRRMHPDALLGAEGARWLAECGWRMPARRTALVSAQAPGDDARVSQQPPPPRPVLLVGEDVALRDLFGHLLELRGHEVLAARDIDDAVRRCQGESVGVVVIENVLPGSSWTALARSLSEQLGADAPPVVMLSGSWAQGDPAASQPGVRTMMAPHRAEQLLDLVARYCREIGRLA